MRKTIKEREEEDPEMKVTYFQGALTARPRLARLLGVGARKKVEKERQKKGEKERYPLLWRGRARKEIER